MATEQQETRICPYCKEEVKADAIKCKHCGSRLEPEGPTHGGTCPFCKEKINPEAIKCMHCGSSLTGSASSAADCDCPPSGEAVAVSAALARLVGWGSPIGRIGGGGLFTDPGHGCWGRCVDDYVACRYSPVPEFICRQIFSECKASCPSSGLQLF
jgi:Double zinc ribbon